jgi:Zn-dependent protease
MRARIASFGDPNRGLFLPVLGFPVKVHPSFWLMAVLAGFEGRGHPGVLIEWTLVVFVSILVHELGHALMIARWSVVHRITIHGFGGETSWRPITGVGWRERVAISLAGPGAGFALALLAYVTGLSLDVHWLLVLAVRDLLWVNVAWGLFNLLPIPPLDGGQALREALGRPFGARGEVYAARVGLAAAFAALIVAIGLEQKWAAALLCFYGFQNFQVLKLHYDLTRKTEWQSTPGSDQTRDRY